MIAQGLGCVVAVCSMVVDCHCISDSQFSPAPRAIVDIGIAALRNICPWSATVVATGEAHLGHYWRDASGIELAVVCQGGGETLLW